ncbi:MAG: TldD/PmbA family protein [Bryobacteraceae bacterium]
MPSINRRDFVKAGSAGVAAIPFALRTDPAFALAAPLGAGATVSQYLTHFGVDSSAIRRVMDAALSRGGDYCDVYFEHKISSYIGVEDKAVDRAYTNVDFGAGIRVLKGDQTGYSFTEDITPKAMEQAARTAAAIAAGPGRKAPAGFKPRETPRYYPIQTGWESVGTQRKVPLLAAINEKVFALDKRIVKCSVYFNDEVRYVLVARSDGRMVADYQPMTATYVSCVAEQDGRREDAYFGLSGRYGLEYYTPQTLDRLASETVRRTVIMFDAVKPAAGEMPVVLAPGSSGILLHEAIGHGMEADFNRKKISIFSDKIGQPVAEKFVSIVDDGTNPNLRGTINTDDEGNPAEKTMLVENGTLRSYLHDHISAEFYKVKPTGNGRRESFRFTPMPRMRNTYMLPGPHKREEIIASVKKGLYAEEFTNGEVRIGAGDFTFYVKLGCLIEDGKLTRPVKDINIIGNGPQILKRITMVADDLKLSEGGGTCGKNGQGMPVQMGLPTVKVSAITVGGVNG